MAIFCTYQISAVGLKTRPIRERTDVLIMVGTITPAQISIIRDEDKVEKTFDLIWDDVSETYVCPIEAALWAEGFPPDEI